jgi:AraC family transcriptional regulator
LPDPSSRRHLERVCYQSDVTSSAIRLAAGQFLGDITRSLDVSDVLLRETRHAVGQVIPTHMHESPHFCLGVAGACVERIGNRDVECVSGTIEYHPAGTCHASRWQRRGGRCFTVSLSAQWASHLASDDRELRPHAGVLGDAPRQLMTRLHRELMYSDTSSRLVIEGLTLALIGDARRERTVAVVRGAPPAWLRRAEEYLRDHAFESVRAEVAAQVAGVHPVLLSRWFRRVHHMTVGEFVRRLRIDRARHLLAASSKPLSAIALECGFVDHAHFTRTFRALVHLTPSDYRRVHGQARTSR